MRPWLELARISNLPTVWTNVLAAWLLAGGGWRDPRWGWLLIGGSLIYTAGMILNDVLDAAFDRQHRAERPIPRGAVSRRAAAWGGGFCLVAGAGVMIGPGGAAWSWVLGLVAVVLLYDAYHKPWAGSVWIMGACRTMLYLSAASSVAESPLAVLAPALAIGAYVVGLSLVARREAPGAARGLAGLPPLLLLAPILLALAVGAKQGLSVLVLALAAGLLIWVSRAISLMRRRPPATIGPAVGRLLAGIVWVDALALAPVQTGLSLAFVALVPLLMRWQRWVAAT
ncbi:MAG: UbiA family prenyltransferase [Verrucomicrobiales bacterium]|nr:UbiA family prenyltransferase [Verrucomicrobiales bacterium]